MNLRSKLSRGDRASNVLVHWAACALGRLACERLAEPSRTARELAELGPLTELLSLDEDSTWEDVDVAVRAAMPSLNGALGAVRASAGLEDSQIFLIALAGAVETSGLVAEVVAELQANDAASRPTLELAAELVLFVFADDRMDAHALHGGALVSRGILRVRGDAPLPLRELDIDPRLWAALRGAPTEWPGCAWLTGASLEHLSGTARDELQHLVAGLRASASRSAAAFLGDATEGRVLVLRGLPASGRREAAAWTARELGLRALEIPFELWRDDVALRTASLSAGWLPVIRAQIAAGETLSLARLGSYAGHVVVLLGRDGAVEDPHSIEFDLGSPEPLQRRAWWRGAGLSPELADECSAAILPAKTIRRLARDARALAERKGEDVELEHVLAARRRMGAEALRLLAQPIERDVPRGALVLAKPLDAALDQLVRRCRRRETVWEGLGPTLASTQSRGVRALFVGESGTGKTLCASALATELGAPLYRVDLAAVMSKWIGESEKNIGRLLELALSVDAVLLFDEADSLFGQRTDASQTGERYANMLTNFLLTRIEDHPGVVVLTGNSRGRIDSAFLRRMDAILEFTLPGAPERADLWLAHLGERGPGNDPVARRRFARFLAEYCDLPGGNVRNVVLDAAACCEGGTLTRSALLGALEREYRKVGRSRPAALAPELVVAREPDERS